MGVSGIGLNSADKCPKPHHKVCGQKFCKEAVNTAYNSGSRNGKPELCIAQGKAHNIFLLRGAWKAADIGTIAAFFCAVDKFRVLNPVGADGGNADSGWI